jgi:hypothetical protein
MLATPHLCRRQQEQQQWRGTYLWRAKVPRIVGTQPMGVAKQVFPLRDVDVSAQVLSSRAVRMVVLVVTVVAWGRVVSCSQHCTHGLTFAHSQVLTPLTTW